MDILRKNYLPFGRKVLEPSDDKCRCRHTELSATTSSLLTLQFIAQEEAQEYCFAMLCQTVWNTKCGYLTNELRQDVEWFD